MNEQKPNKNLTLDQLEILDRIFDRHFAVRVQLNEKPNRAERRKRASIARRKKNATKNRISGV